MEVQWRERTKSFLLPRLSGLRRLGGDCRLRGLRDLSPQLSPLRIRFSWLLQHLWAFHYCCNITHVSCSPSALSTCSTHSALSTTCTLPTLYTACTCSTRRFPHLVLCHRSTPVSMQIVVDSCGLGYGIPFLALLLGTLIFAYILGMLLSTGSDVSCF